jgi:hypothetical protein
MSTYLLSFTYSLTTTTHFIDLAKTLVREAYDSSGRR